MNAEAPSHRAPAGRPAKHVVALTATQRQDLRRLTRTGRSAARTLTHARILLQADTAAGGPGWHDAQIQTALGVSPSTIVRVRRRFVRGGLEAALHRRPPTRVRQRRLDGAQEAHLIALACGTPPDGHARWTLRLLADRFVLLEGSTPVSYETVRRTLKKTSSSHG